MTAKVTSAASKGRRKNSPHGGEGGRNYMVNDEPAYDEEDYDERKLR